MSTGVWAAIGLALLKLLSWLRGGYRATVEVRSEAAIADERKHHEELKKKIGRIENELKALAPQITAAITACDGHRVIELDAQRRKLRADWDIAKDRLDSFERDVSQGR